MHFTDGECMKNVKDIVFHIIVQVGSWLGFTSESIATVGEIQVYRRADFQSGSRVLKKVF